MVGIVCMLKSAFEIEENTRIEKIRVQEARVSEIAKISDAEILNRLWELEKPVNRILDQSLLRVWSVERCFRSLVTARFWIGYRQSSTQSIIASTGRNDYLELDNGY